MTNPGELLTLNSQSGPVERTDGSKYCNNGGLNTEKMARSKPQWLP